MGGVTANITMDDAANFAWRDGIQVPNKKPSDYFDDGRSITTTFSQFCQSIDSHAPLFHERKIEGLNQPFRAYTFNLVAGKNVQTEILAKIIPISPSDTLTKCYNVLVNSAAEMKLLLEEGEPVLLTRKNVPFAVMCPADKYVWDKLVKEFQ